MAWTGEGSVFHTLFVRWLLRKIFRLWFGLKVFHEEVLQTPGPLVLAANHVSVWDWFLLYAVLGPEWKFVISRTNDESQWFARWILGRGRTLEVDTTSAHGAKAVGEYLRRGGRLVIFPEGRVSRTGSLMKFYEGIGFLLHQTGAYLVPCYIWGADRSLGSPSPNRKRWRPRVTIHFGQLCRPPREKAFRGARGRERLTQWARDRLVELIFWTEMEQGPRHLVEAITEAARGQLNRVALEDVTGSRLTFRRVLAGARLLAGELEKRLEPGVDRVGILLPSSNAAAVSLLALWLLDRVPTILNFTMGGRGMAQCAGLAGLRQILTSKAFLERTGLDVSELVQRGFQILFLEDLREGIGLWQKGKAFLLVTLGPKRLWRAVEQRLRRRAIPVSPSDRPAAVVFTSGSEGIPKGVELSHRNILANIRQLLAVVDVTDEERMFNALPVFHSFGLTVGICAGLVRGFYSFQYPSPLHYRVIPTLVYEHECTVLISTNTFLQGYARAAHPYDFRSLRYLFAGAEKLQPQTARLWAERFGVRVLEGYGVTECSPVVAVNTPMAPKAGSVGRFLPGMEYRIEPVEGIRRGGRLWVRGPNVMQRYLNPEADARFQAANGWYDTGDIGWVDEEGYLYIEGRARRFAKIGGEMVSLTAAEETFREYLAPEQEGLDFALVAIPDSERGERIVAVTTDRRVTPDRLRQLILSHRFPRLWIPSAVFYVNELPRLGTGKPDYPTIQELAMQQLQKRC